MFPRTTEMAFARFQAKGEAQALAIVFDRTAPELLKVARHLSPSPGDAEDLVQATFLAAIESKASYERGRPVLPWLLGILANQARAHRRSARRQPDPTRVRGDDVADVHAEVSGHELRRELVTAIDRLPEAYRAVMRLWLEHGLEPHEIATTLERPSGTVRSQISRGLDMLRQALPASLAGSAAVAVATGHGLAAIRSHLLRECAGTSSSIASALAVGGLFMLHQKLLSAGVVLAIGLISWYAVAPPEPVQPPAVDTNTVTVADSGDFGRVSDVAGAEAVQRQAVEPTGAPAVSPAADVVALRASIAVHLCAMSDDAPLPGYGVALRMPGDAENIAIAPVFTVTDAQGNVRFDDVEPGSYVIEVDRVGVVGESHVAAVAGELIERRFEIPESVIVEGVVVDAAGQPVAGADVVMQASRLASPRVAVSDALGRFTVRHIRPQCSLMARKRGYSPSPLWLVKGENGQRVKMELQLTTATRRISGQVFDDQGQVIHGAAVAVIDAESRNMVSWRKPQVPPIWLRSDREGRFVTDEVGASRYIVLARSPQLDIAPSWADVDTRVNDAYVELRSSESIVIEGRVQRSGQPVPHIRINVWPEKSAADIGYLLNLVGMRQCRTDADGAFRIVGMLPGDLGIQAWRQANMVGDIRRSVAAGETVRWDLDLDASNTLKIQVTAPGELSPHLMALVYDATKPNSAPGMEHIGAGGSVTHQRRGTGPVDIVLCLLQGAPNVIQLARRQVPASVSTTHFELGAEDLPTRMLRGRLVDANLAPVAAQTVRARRTGDELMVMLEATSQADGSFAIGPLPSGDYIVQMGSLRDAKTVGRGVVSSARDEDLGDLTVPK